MKVAAVKALIIAALRTAEPVFTARRVVGALSAKAEVRTAEDAEMQPFRTALADDLRPLGDALWQAMQTPDGEAMRAGLRKIAAGLATRPSGDALAGALALASAREFLTPTTPDE